MAKTEGDQSIPAELLDGYRATLAEQRPNKAVWKRYPYHVPRMQEGSGNVTVKQQGQRAAFKNAVAKFKALSETDKQRWYSTMPEWSSLLWYYNWFMLNAIPNLWGVVPGGAAILKNILNRTLEIPIAGTTITHATIIDASKCVVFLFGAGHSDSWDQVGDYPYGWAWAVMPIWGTLSNTNISLTWAENPTQAAKVAMQIIEYI